MALAQLGKQLAQQVVGEHIQDMVDSLRPESAKPVELGKSPGATAGGPPLESLSTAILGQVQAMQRACKEDQELVVLCHAGDEPLRILEFYSPSAVLLVMTGIDAERNVTRVILPIHSVQLVCKVKSVAAGAKPVRVNFLLPKPKA